MWSKHRKRSALRNWTHKNSSRKKGRKPEKKRSSGGQKETSGRGEHTAPLWAPQTWVQEWPLHSHTAGGGGGVTSSGLPRPPPACLTAPPSTLTRRGRATRAKSRAHTRDSLKKRAPPAKGRTEGPLLHGEEKKERRNYRLTHSAHLAVNATLAL